MAAQIKTALPPNHHLGGGYIIEWDAVDPTTGASVAGVTVTNTSLFVASLTGTMPDIPNPILVASTA